MSRQASARFYRIGSSVLFVSLTALLTSHARAAFRYWVDPAGGLFSSTANWSDDGVSGGASVPGAGDAAYFAIDSTYDVTFSGNAVSDFLLVYDGAVSFQSNTTAVRQYQVTSEFQVAGSTTANIGAANPDRPVWLEVAGQFISDGTVVVNGNGSRFDAHGNGTHRLLFGGTLTYQNGAYGTIEGTVNVGVADYTTAGGYLNVFSAATLNVDHLRVGTDTLAPGEVTVSGPGSILLQTLGAWTLSVGAPSGGNSKISVIDGGVWEGGTGLATLNATGTMVIDGGTFNLNGPLTNTGGTIDVRNGGAFNTGTGAILLNAGGTINVLSGGEFTTSTGVVRLNPGGTIRLDGGVFNLRGPVNNTGGAFTFIAGALNVAGNIPIGDAAELLANSLTLSSNRLMNVTGTTTIEPFHTLTLDGGSLTTDNLAVNGTLDFRRGTLAITGAGGLAIGTGGPLGATVAISGGQRLVVTNSLALGYDGLLLVSDDGRVQAAGVTNQGEIELAGSQATLAAASVTNIGLLHGHGKTNGALINQTSGEVRAGANQRLAFTDGGTHTNAGVVNLQGGTVEFIGEGLLNEDLGRVIGRGTLITNDFGLENSGEIALSSGISDVFGDVANATGGRITVSGNADVTFWDDVDNSGTLFRVSAGSSATFFGTLGGAGVSGPGNVFIEADITPGFSPGTMNFGGDVSLGPLASLTVELGGTTPGSQHDQMNVAGDLALDGTLAISLVNGHVPAVGDLYQIATWGSRTGTFGSITGQTPVPGIVLSQIYRANDLILFATAPGEKTWGVDASGNASVGANWIGGVAPGGIGDAAAFTTIITAPRTVTIDAPLTLGLLRFDDNNNYTLAGPNTITLEHGGANHAAINVLNLHGNGQHTISAPLLVVSDLDIAQNSAGELTLSGGLATNAGRSITKTGTGTLSISGLQSYGVGASFSHQAGTLNLLTDAGAGGANLTLIARSTANFTSTQHLAALKIAENVTNTLTAGGGKVLVTSSLVVDTGGQLNLTDSDFVLQSTAGNRLADAAAIEQLVASGFAAFAWNGPGIASAAAASDPELLTALGIMLNDDGLGGPFHTLFAGQAVDANSILVKYTYYGDADLSGSVDGTDYALIDNGFNSGLAGWFHGDFDYSGAIDGTDYALIDNAFNNQSGPLSAGPVGPAVPEPPPWALAALGGLIALARCRRRP